LLSPAAGDRMIARGRVVKPGKTLTVCTADVVAVTNGREKTIATMTGTLMAIYDRPDVSAGVLRQTPQRGGPPEGLFAPPPPPVFRPPPPGSPPPSRSSPRALP